ncbi:MAG: hypothetical protein JXL97_18075 [Bacteroidales bacterium]|nr:hypothetical protein [Bacteroidales bacterium]
MITRIVKMVFQEDKTDDFKVFIKPIVNRIASFEGCQKVEILQDVKKKMFFSPTAIGIMNKIYPIIEIRSFLMRFGQKPKKWLQINRMPGLQKRLLEAIKK